MGEWKRRERERILENERKYEGLPISMDGEIRLNLRGAMKKDFDWACEN